jgi:hypothetical protein
MSSDASEKQQKSTLLIPLSALSRRMDAIRRLKESSTALNDPPSPSGSTTTPSPGAHSPSSTRDSVEPEGEAEAGPSGTNQIPWYRISRREHPKSKHGYEPYKFSIVSPPYCAYLRKVLIVISKERVH